MTPTSTRVVIIGAGFAGVRVARDLGRARPAGVEIVLINKDAYHEDTTGLYEVATAALAHESEQSSEVVRESVLVPLSEVISGLPVDIQVGRVRQFELEQRMIILDHNQTVSFDILVVALGTTAATFGVPGVPKYTYGLKTVHEALELRHHITRQFHSITSRSTPQQKAALTFVVAGAGTAGVETVAELASYITQQSQAHHLSPHEIRIILAEAGPVILRMLPAALQAIAGQRLQKLGIEIMCDHAISEVTGEAVHFRNGTIIPTNTVVWTGGLAAHPIVAASNLPLSKWGIRVTPSLQVVGFPHVFAAGDCAIAEDVLPALPATVPVAYSQGSLVAKNIVRLLRGQILEAYRSPKLGTIVTLGGKQALLVYGGRMSTASGFLPWLIKQGLLLRYWLGYLSPGAAWRFWTRSEIIKMRNDTKS